MLLWVGVSFIEIIITRELTPHSFITFVPPLTYFISPLHFADQKKVDRRIRDVDISAFYNWNRYSFAVKQMKAVDYTGLYPQSSKYESFIKEKKVLVLG